MNLGLSKFKYAAFASEETNCFEAVVTIDGKPVFHVSNEGRGGPDRHSPLPGQTGESYRNNLKAVEDYAASLPPFEAYGTTLTHCIETVIGKLVTRELMRKDLTRLLTKKAVFIKGKDLYTCGYTGWKPQQYTQQHWDRLKAARPGVEFLNQMPFDQALTLYMGTAS